MTLPDHLQVCRLCVLKYSNFANIFEINGKLDIRVADIINELLELNVYPGDGLPEKICCDCLNELARFKRFKSISHEAKVTLECIIKENPVSLPKTSSPSSKHEESNIVEIVDLFDNDDTEDSGAETVAAPSPLSNDSSSDELIMESEDVPEESDCKIVCVAMEHDSVEEPSSSVSINTKPSSSKSGAVCMAMLKDLSRRRDDKMTPNPKDPLDVESPLEIDPESDSDSIITLESESDIVEIEVEELHSDVAVTEPEHCSRTLGYIRASKDLEKNAAMPEKHKQQVGKGREEVSGKTTLDLKESSNEVALSDDKFKCSCCSKTFGSDWELKNHMKQNACVEYRCYNCDKLLASENEFLKHVKRCIRKSNHICQVCGKVFENELALKGHKGVHSKKETNYRCKKCKVKFTRKRELESHTKKCKSAAITESVIYYKCGVCKNGYKCYRSFRKHFSTHHVKCKDGICGVCGAVCNGAVELRNHVWDCHGTLECDFCPKKFVENYFFKKHVSVHSSQRPYYCSECGTTYKTQWSLNVHVSSTHKN